MLSSKSSSTAVGLRDQPRRLSLVGGGLQLVERSPHIAQRCLDRGEGIEVDAAVVDAQAIDVDLFERVGHRRRSRGARGTHVDDRVTVLGK